VDFYPVLYHASTSSETVTLEPGTHHVVVVGQSNIPSPTRLNAVFTKQAKFSLIWHDTMTGTRSVHTKNIMNYDVQQKTEK